MSFRRSRRPDEWPTVHDRARADLSDQLDGILEPSETDWLDEHLAVCAECRTAADDYAAERLALRALRDRPPLPPRDLWARTAAAIEAEAASRSTAGRGWPRRLITAPSALIATTLVAVVVVGTLFSSRLTGGDGSPGSSFEVARNSPPAAASAGTSAPAVTPLPEQKQVEVAKRDANGNTVISTARVRVCPDGAAQPCDSSAPVEEGSVTIDQEASAVYGDEAGERFIVVSGSDTADSGTVSVVTTADTLGGEPSPSIQPSSAPPATASPTPPSSPPSAAPTPTPPPATASPSPSEPATVEPSASIEITPSPANPAKIEIAHGVTLVGETAAYSPSGQWFAFTARPIDQSAGPDIYLWRVGSTSAARVTSDGRSVFGSWVEDRLVGSAATDGAGPSGEIATTGLDSTTFLLDPATAAVTTFEGLGSAWRPVVSPTRDKAVFWSGTLQRSDDQGFVPDHGRLVVSDWDASEPAPSESPDATSTASAKVKDRHDQTIAAGQVLEWDARWDASGTHLAVWIADRKDLSVGRLSLYALDTFDGSLDLQHPLLDGHLAKPGFAIADESLIWAAPSSDPATDGTIQLLAWGPTGVAAIQTVTGPGLVIR